MLQRSSQVGEFYRMMPPPVWDHAKVLPGQYMDLLIYDEETDQLKHIEFEQALYATGATTQGLNLLNLLVGPGPYPGGAANAGAYWAALTATPIPDPGAGAPNQAAYRAAEAARVLVSVPAPDLAVIIDAVRKGVWLPICITIARPFIEHLMMSCIATVSGRDTGATLFGPAGKSLHHTLPLSLFPLSHIHTHLLRASTLSLCSGHWVTAFKTRIYRVATWQLMDVQETRSSPIGPGFGQTAKDLHVQVHVLAVLTEHRQVDGLTSGRTELAVSTAVKKDLKDAIHVFLWDAPLKEQPQPYVHGRHDEQPTLQITKLIWHMPAIEALCHQGRVPCAIGVAIPDCRLVLHSNVVAHAVIHELWRRPTLLGGRVQSHRQLRVQELTTRLGMALHPQLALGAQYAGQALVVFHQLVVPTHQPLLCDFRNAQAWDVPNTHSSGSARHLDDVAVLSIGGSSVLFERSIGQHL